MHLKMNSPLAPRLTCLVLIFVIFYVEFLSGDNKHDISARGTCEGAKSGNPNMHCCNRTLYSPETDTCCRYDREYITEGLSEKVSRCCGPKAYLPLNEICCHFTLQPKPSPMAKCCGKVAIDGYNELCCGENKTLTKISPNHRCCHEGQYNIQTECCCDNGEIQRKSKDSDCCVIDHPNKEEEHHRAKPKTHFCGTKPYDPKRERCCQKKHGDINKQCPSGLNASSAVYDPNTRICCDGCLSRLTPLKDQCCGDTPYGLAEKGVLCCKNTLFEDREDGEECSESGVPYRPLTETVCASKQHSAAGGHCCGEEIYQPTTTICCKGQRHNRTKHIRCCGVHAYNISDHLQKCCEGTLHNLKGKGDKCCGSALVNTTDICCTSEEQSLSYPAKAGFQCCGHNYYNSSLWSCCAGKLSPVHKTVQQKPMTNESKLLLVNNLDKTQLCSEIFIGIVESVSQSGIVFSNLLKINGRDATVGPDVFTLNVTDKCKFLRLTVGKTYFFNDMDIFTDFNHESVLQLLHFVLSKCSQ
ncbi:galaxin isoform X2 [Fundulus heteroclitus]|uniref:galaxin isoform X2 n=1 Tax=Fundulus heteroclitus TaxID=8078 RepID=UPI00165AD82D|nr:galaxin isoform X2 [Fundulus heteroclitus]